MGPDVSEPARLLVLVAEALPAASAASSLRSRFEAFAPRNPQEAVQRIAAGAVDVLLLSVALQEATLAPLLRALAEAAPDPVRVLLAGDSELTGLARVTSSGGAFRILRRPCTEMALTAALEDAAEAARVRRLERGALGRLARYETALRSIALTARDAGVLATAGSAPTGWVADRLSNLSRREWQVLLAGGRGEPTQHVASALHISPHTVRNHLKSIFRKLGVSSRAELAALVGAQLAR